LKKEVIKINYNPAFSINLYDKDGDIYEECINIHLRDKSGFILQFENLDAYDSFVKNLQFMRKEIVENL